MSCITPLNKYNTKKGEECTCYWLVKAMRSQSYMCIEYVSSKKNPKKKRERKRREKKKRPNKIKEKKEKKKIVATHVCVCCLTKELLYILLDTHKKRYICNI